VTEPPLSLKASALQWLAQREHSQVELRRKLLRLAHELAAPVSRGDAADPAGEVDALLAWLIAHRYLSDARFVESRVNARVARYGNLRIRQELGQHGAALDAATAERLRDSELSRARAVWVRKYGSEPATSAAERARQMRFLAGRGFSADVVRRVIRGMPDDGDDSA
jgi:regulatory protein